MASVSEQSKGESKSNGKPFGRTMENGLLSPVSEKLDLEETGQMLGDELEMTEVVDEVEPPMGEIKQDLDTLSSTGSTINDLEMQLTRVKAKYKRILNEAREKLDTMRKKLGSNIRKSEPFIEIWRKARQIQELSNKAAARFDKANSQHMAAKEMIRMAESQLSKDIKEGQIPSSPSPIDLAWQEMLNHATIKVVETARERQESEVEHKRIMEECTRVMEEYKNTEKRLRSHIVKSRPYYEERFRCNQKLQQLRLQMQTLENQIAASKKTYSAALKKLEVLNTEIHRRRRSTMSQQNLDSRKSFSTGNSPEPMRTRLDVRTRVRGGSGSFVGSGSVSLGGASDTESVSSLQLGDLKDQFSGSTGSLPSIGASSISENSPSPSPTPEPNTDEDNPIIMRCAEQQPSTNRQVEGEVPHVEVNFDPTVTEDDCRTPTAVQPEETELHSDPVETLASQLVEQTLDSVLAKVGEGRTTDPVTIVPQS